MALIKCPECGKEVSHQAKICPNCGMKLITLSSLLSKKSNIIKKIVIGLLALVIVGTGIMIFVRPNMNMDKFRSNNVVGAILQYGIPSEIDEGEWVYYNCIKFYDVPIDRFVYDPNTTECSMTFTEHIAEVERLLDRYCEYERSVLFLSYYSYKDLELIASFDDIAVINIHFK